jgi:hypothetical protein
MLLLAVPAIAQTVTIDGSVANFNPPPIERAGRVFVPLRGVFPLRFVSQSLGASVNYDNGTNTVAINTNGGGQVASNGYSRHARLAPGSVITGSLGSDLNTGTANVGDQFVVNVVAPYPNDDTSYANAYVRGQVVAVTRAGQGTRPQLGLAFNQIVFADGRTMPVAGHVTSTDEKHASAIPQQAIGALAGMLVGNVLGKVVLHTSVGGIAGAAGGFLYANNLKTNFVVPKSSTVVIQVDQPLRQAGQ